MSYQIEICANSVQSAINAEKGGANRVELCDNLWEGGTTPSMATIVLAKQQVSIDVYVLIRPRGGDFVYSDLEFEIIKKDILLCKEAGVDGIVCGVLLPSGEIDIGRTKELVKLSHPLPFTFHRAFDHVDDIEKGIADLKECGVVRVLTSDQKSRAIDGLDNLMMMSTFAGDEISIMPGGGVNTENIQKLHARGFREFHFSAKSHVKGQKSYSNKVPMNGSKDIPEETIQVSDTNKIQEIKKLLDAIN